MRLESSETKRLGFAMQLEAQWIVGFVDGEGFFRISIHRDAIGYQVSPEFIVVQDQRNIRVLYALKAYFGCGVVCKTPTPREMLYSVKSIKHLMKRIIPFFEMHVLKTKKQIGFQNFRKVVLKMHENEHLSPEEIEEIRRLKGKMDRWQTKIESDPIGNSRE